MKVCCYIDDMYFLLVGIDWWKPVLGRNGVLKTPSNKKAVLWNTFHEIMFSIKEDDIAVIMPFYSFDNTYMLHNNGAVSSKSRTHQHV